MQTQSMLKICMAMCAILIANCVHAVTINFDDIYAPPEGPDCLCPQPASDEYLSQGLRIANAFFSGGGTPEHPSNSLGGFGNGISLSFVGNLPTHVETYVDVSFDQATYFDVYDSTGALAFRKHTNGWTGDPDESTPYVPHELMKLDLAGGISGISITPTYDLRIGAFIDDLTFTYAVPEPSTILLMGLGLLCVGIVRVREQ